MGYQKILADARDLFPLASFLAYIDDTYFVCARSRGADIVRWIGTAMAKIGLRLNIAKSACLDPTAPATGAAGSDGITVTNQGFVALGGPVIGAQGGDEPDVQEPDVLDALGVPDRSVVAPVGNPGFQADSQN